MLSRFSSRCAAGRCSGWSRWPRSRCWSPGARPRCSLGALAGYVFFTVVLWGSIYYHLRTGAPWTNGLRFWRLVLTNSDPTSGNALEQVPKIVMTLSAGNLLAEDADLASVRLDRDRRRRWWPRRGTLAWRWFARDAAAALPGRAPQPRRRPSRSPGAST